jgi:hypothetical protein
MQWASFKNLCVVDRIILKWKVVNWILLLHALLNKVINLRVAQDGNFFTACKVKVSEDGNLSV